jgi:hypothetical protein
MIFKLSKSQKKEVERLHYEPRAYWLELPKVPWELAIVRAMNFKIVCRMTVAQAMAL